MRGKKRLLVIEDEEVLRELVVSMLEETDAYAVTAVPDGESGLEEIRSRRPDLALLDLGLVGMSGWEVLDRLKQHAAPPPVIVMSGSGDREPSELAALGRFVQAYLSKPFRLEQLTAACERVLSLTAAAAPPLAAERRREPRRNLVVEATLLSPIGTPVAVGQLLNFTASGAVFELGAALPVGAEMKLRFEMPGSGGPFSMAVRAGWSRRGEVGLVFLDLSDADRSRLSDLLA